VVRCLNCEAASLSPFIDLGSAPLSNGYLTESSLAVAESWHPLRVVVCSQCWLAQTVTPLSSTDIFTTDYAYFSSTSASWLRHSERFVADATTRFNLDESSMVIEVAANDGYLLQIIREREIPCVGIEPTTSTANAARARGIPIVEEFLGRATGEQTAQAYGAADLVVGNNVLAHVPDIHDFVAGIRALLKPNGVVSLEFPWVTALVDGSQFDTIYHEHYSYLSLHSVASILGCGDMVVFDVEEIPTHGGSLRVFAQHEATGAFEISAAVPRLMQFERDHGVTTLDYYETLQDRAEQIKNGLLSFLLQCKESGAYVAAYGAAAKGNTLLNFAGVRPDLLPFVVDRSSSKIGKWMPGSRIPILKEDAIRCARPDFMLILPWNIADEVTEQLSYVRNWGGRFVQAVPGLETW